MGVLGYMEYAVLFVPDDELPPDIKRVMVERREQVPLLILAESGARNWRFVQEWERRYSEEQNSRPHLRAV